MFAKAFSWIGRNAVSFLAILAVLVVGSTLIAFGREVFGSSDASPEQLTVVVQKLEREVPRIREQVLNETRARLQKAQNETVQQINDRIQKRRSEQAELTREKDATDLTRALLRQDLPALERLSRIELELAAIKQEIQTLEKLRPYAEVRSNHSIAFSKFGASHAELQKLAATYNASKAAYERNLKALRDFEKKNPEDKEYLETFSRTLDPQYGKIIDDYSKSKAAYERTSADLVKHHKKYMAVKEAEAQAKAAVRRVEALGLPTLIDDQAPISLSLIKEEADRLSNRWQNKVRAALPIAAAIWLAAILLPVALKALGYFVFAPVAQKLRPVEVLPGESGQLLLGGRTPQSVEDGEFSKVSVPVTVGEDEELLIHPDYLQSTGNAGDKATQWLLDWSHPFTSLASGLAMLTRIRPSKGEPVVVSSRKDPFSEVGIITIPEGSAAVLQPRSLAGVVQKQGKPLRITSHWRFGTLHAWLTWQMRFLVFHGPVTVIAKGTRGVRVEPAGSGRSINQAATIGFSAGVGYAVRRCETFISYLRGEQDLFNDTLSGGQGFYIYEEMPAPDHRKSLAGRGIEGLVDAGLKVFGV